MIKLLLEGFDPGRRPLLFYVEFWPVAPVRDGPGSIVQIWQCASGSAICAHFANRRKQLRRSALAAIAGVLRVVYPDTPLTMFFWDVRAATTNCGAVRRHGGKLDGASSLGARPW